MTMPAHLSTCLPARLPAHRPTQVCDKRYVKVKEFENHLSSYDHHHRKRFKEMKETEKVRHGLPCDTYTMWRQKRA